MLFLRYPSNRLLGHSVCSSVYVGAARTAAGAYGGVHVDPEFSPPGRKFVTGLVFLGWSDSPPGWSDQGPTRSFLVFLALKL